MLKLCTSAPLGFSICICTSYLIFNFIYIIIYIKYIIYRYIIPPSRFNFQKMKCCTGALVHKKSKLFVLPFAVSKNLITIKGWTQFRKTGTLCSELCTSAPVQHLIKLIV